MNYKESAKILKEIEKADRILLNCHRRPDPDSVGSALALKSVLEDMDKKVKVICPTEVEDGLNFLKNFDSIKTVDFTGFDFEDFDLFITLDSASVDMVTGVKGVSIGPCKLITIDHHASNTHYGDINLVDEDVSSCAELLYFVFEDWGVKKPELYSEELLTGIFGDTGGLRHPNVSSKTFGVAMNLTSHTDKNKIISNLYYNYNLDSLKLVGEFLSGLRKDATGFVWTSIDFETYEKFSNPDKAKEIIADNFSSAAKAVKFGITMLEDRERKLGISFRSRGGFDVSKIAIELGGGGHKAAAGASVEGLSFEEAVEKVLKVARKHAKKNR